MNDRWQERLSEYLDGNLSAAERGEAEVHIAACATCAAALEALRRVRSLAAGLTDAPVPEGLWASIETRIGAGRPAPTVSRAADSRSASSAPARQPEHRPT